MFLETRAGRIAYVAGLTLVLSALGFWAAVEVGVPTTTVAQAAMTDAPFAKSAQIAELQNSRLAQLAKDKAQNPALQDFAAQIATGQVQASDALKRAAWRENIALPTSVAVKDQAAYDRLSALDGQQFDRAYAAQMVRAFTDVLQVYRHEAATGNDDVMRQFALESVPVLEKNLNEARAVLKKVTPSGKKSSNADVPPRGR